MNYYIAQSNQTRLPQRVPQLNFPRSYEVSQSKPDHGWLKRHETLLTRHTQPKMVPTYPIPTVVGQAVTGHAEVSIPITFANGNDNNKDAIPYKAPYANLIKLDEASVSNIFAFAAFADKCNGTLYLDMTRTFPFMSLQGNVCFLVLYHNKFNAKLAMPIANFTDDAILAAYTNQFEYLESKGH